MKNPIVVAVNALRNLSPADYKTVLALTRKNGPTPVKTPKAPKAEAQADPSAPPKRKPGPKPGTPRKQRIATLTEAELDAKFPKDAEAAAAPEAEAPATT